MFGSFGLRPIDVNGSNPAIAPKPMWLFSWVSGSCGFWPACIVGSGCGVEDAPLAGAARAASFTMRIVCDVYPPVLYVRRRVLLILVVDVIVAVVWVMAVAM